MKTPAITTAILCLLQVFASAAEVSGEIDSICRDHCQILAVQKGGVILIDEWPPARTVDLGKYAPAAQGFVPRNEAAVRDLRSPNGWHVVASVYLDHEQDDVLVHVRFFEPNKRLVTTTDALELLERFEIGRLAGGKDELLAFASTEEHSYNDQTELWYLPPNGEPKLVLTVAGTFNHFTPYGVVVSRQTYDGVHSQTKGTVEEQYVWDHDRQTMAVQQSRGG